MHQEPPQSFAVRSTHSIPIGLLNNFSTLQKVFELLLLTFTPPEITSRLVEVGLSFYLRSVEFGQSLYRGLLLHFLGPLYLWYAFIFIKVNQRFLLGCTHAPCDTGRLDFMREEGMLENVTKGKNKKSQFN